MRKVMVLTALLTAISAAVLPAGDIKFIMIKYYNDPQWREGSIPLSDEYYNSMYFELKGESAVRHLDDAGCPYLAMIYKAMAGEGDIPWIAKRIAAMREETLYVYLICDGNGLTTVMKDFVGACDYDDPSDDTSQRYAWPCAHTSPERAIKIGEHFAESLYKGYMQHKLAYNTEGWANAASMTTYLGALFHTVASSSWQPNDFLLKPDAAAAGLLAQAVNRLPADQKAQMTQILTLMPTEQAANIRAIELFLMASASGLNRRILEEFYLGKGLFAVAVASNVHTNLGDNAAAQDLPGNIDCYLYKSIPLEKLVFNEVFIALALRYFVSSQPPIKDVFGDDIYALVQVLKHFETNREASVGLVDILSTLMENYAKSPGANIRNRRLFLIGLLDLLSHYSAEKQMIQAVLEITVIPSADIGPLLDTYFGSHRAALQTEVKDSGDLAEKVRALIDRFQQNEYDYFKTK